MPSYKSASTKDVEALYQAAVKALARRARSSGELRQYLSKRKASQKDIEAILKRLRENGYVDDARFARAFAASRLQNDLHGKARVRRDLAARRVHPEVIQQALGAAYDEVDEGQLLRQYLRRKVRLRHPPDKPSAWASLYRRLLRAGFASATIVRELKQLFPRRGASDSSAWEEQLESLSEADESEPRLP